MGGSSGGSAGILIVLFITLIAFGPWLMRRMLNPVENAASNAYRIHKNEISDDGPIYLASRFRDVGGLAPELAEAIAHVPDRAPEPGDRGRFGVSAGNETDA